MKRFVVTGFVIWAAATIALRLSPGGIFRSPLLLLAVSLPLMIGMAMAILPNDARRPLAAIALVAPGMLLDTASAIWFTRIFPNIPADRAGVFGGWLLFCNIVVLLTAVTAGRRPAPESAAQSR